MGNNKKFSLIISYFLSDEQQHGTEINPCRVKNANILAKTLSEQDFDRDSYECIVMTDDPCPYTDLHNFADRAIHMPHRRLFNKSWFFNNAARVALSDRLFFLDLDVEMPPGYLQMIADKTTDRNQVYSGLTHFKRECQPGVWDNGIYVNRCTLGYSSVIYKDKYWELGGMCENFRGYGGEDGEMYVKHAPILHLKGTMTHPYHNDSHVDWKAYSENVHLCQAVREHTDEYLKRLIPESINYGNPEKEHYINFNDLLEKTVNPHKR